MKAAKAKGKGIEKKARKTQKKKGISSLYVSLNPFRMCLDFTYYEMNRMSSCTLTSTPRPQPWFDCLMQMFFTKTASKSSRFSLNFLSYSHTSIRLKPNTLLMFGHLVEVYVCPKVMLMVKRQSQNGARFLQNELPRLLVM